MRVLLALMRQETNRTFSFFKASGAGSNESRARDLSRIAANCGRGIATFPWQLRLNVTKKLPVACAPTSWTA